MAQKVFRSNTDKKIAGVCGGLGEYFDIDPLFIRLLFIVALFGYGTGVLAYIVLWVLMPTKCVVRDYSFNSKVENYTNLNKSGTSFE